MFVKSKISGVELHQTIDLVTSLKSKKKLNIISIESFESFEVISINSNQVIWLILNDNNIISKQVTSIDKDEALQLAFPNINLNDFYYEILTIYNASIVNICRKEYVDSILNDLKSKKLNVIGFSLGNSDISQLEGVYEESELLTSDSLISFTNGKVSDIKKVDVTPTKFQINGLELTNNQIIPFAGILSYISGEQKTISNFTAVNQQLKSEFQQQQFFNTGFKIALGVIFSLLLISFLFFSNYNDKVNELTSTLAVSKTQKNNLIELKEDVDRKKQLLEEISSSSSRVSWYLDQIGSSVPASIKLNELNWQPLNKSIKENQPLHLEENQIIIKGVSGDEKVFSQWAETLEQLDWVKSITVNDYGVGKKTQTAFELQLLIQ